MSVGQTGDSSSRKRILITAKLLFLEHGYHGLSMRQIAEAVGISKAGIYYHFKDKEELFTAVLVSSLAEIEALIKQAETEGQTSRQRITGLVTKMMAQPPEQRAVMRLASQEISQLSQSTRVSFLQTYHRKFISQIEAIIKAGITTGELRDLDPSLTTWTLLGMMYPYFYPSQANEIGPAEQAITEMLSIFFDGIALNSEGSSS